MRRTSKMTERDELLANAAQAIKEQRQDAENGGDGEGKRKQERMEPPDGTAPTGVEGAG
ncbi:hypothetical protein D3C86_2191000 [compost metagenome]